MTRHPARAAAAIAAKKGRACASTQAQRKSENALGGEATCGISSACTGMTSSNMSSLHKTHTVRDGRHAQRQSEKPHTKVMTTNVNTLEGGYDVASRLQRVMEDAREKGVHVICMQETRHTMMTKSLPPQISDTRYDRPQPLTHTGATLESQTLPYLARRGQNQFHFESIHAATLPHFRRDGLQPSAAVSAP